MSAGHEYEEVETVPWSSLVVETKPRPLLVYVAAAVVVALALGLLAGRTLLRSSGPQPEAEVSVGQAARPLPLAASVPQQTSDPGRVDVPRSHVALAEWFTTDYFTVDGDGGREGDIGRLLGPGAPDPVVPTATYVEWARAWSVTPTPDGTEVTVAFRTITAITDGFARDPVRAVLVVVHEAPGGPMVAGLPRPASVTPAQSDGVGFTLDVPEGAARTAVGEAENWGEEAGVAGGAYHDHGGWTVLTQITDYRGNSWPLVVNTAIPESTPK